MIQNGIYCNAIVYLNDICYMISELPFKISKTTRVSAGPLESNVMYRLEDETEHPVGPMDFLKEKSKSIIDGHKICEPKDFMNVGNGFCDDGSNTAECGWDNFECCGIAMQKGKCSSCHCHMSGQAPLDIEKGNKIYYMYYVSSFK